MEGLTSPRQWTLGLAMMAADRASGLSIEERRWALQRLQEGKPVPGPWHPTIEAYLERRALRQQKGIA